jgi:endonuclease/exonuclease/phosphatase family metal-dependent hydrolase
MDNSIVDEAPYFYVDELEEEMRIFSIEEKEEIEEYSARRSSLLFTNYNNWKETFSILSWNIHGDTVAGYSMLRKLLVEQVLRSTYPDIIFIQECQWVQPFLQIAFKVYGRYYDYQGNVKQAGIAFDSTKFKKENIDLDKLINKLPANSIVERGYKKAIPSRTFALKLTSKKSGKSFLVVSFHGLYNRLRDNERILSCKWFFNSVIGKLHEQYGLPIFIGGDFNCDIMSCDCDGITILQFDPSSRRQNVVDFLCFKSCITDNVKGAITSAQTIDLDIRSETFSNLQSTILKDRAIDETKYNLAMDHDPLAAKLCLNY